MALIFSLGFVSFRDFSRRQSLQSATRNLISDLRLAQNYALSGKKPDSIFCDSPSVLQGYNFEVTGETDYKISASCSGGTVSVKEIALSDEFVISTPTTNPIVFKTLGQGTNIPDSLVITLTQTATNNVQIVTVTSGGEIR
jgi:Tfp pilus assembly protein FimT